MKPKIKVCILMNSLHVGANIVLNKIIRDKNIKIVGIFKKDIWATSTKKNKQGAVNAFWRWGNKAGYYFLFSLIIVVAFHFLQVLIIEILFLGILFRNRRFLKSSRLLAQENNIKLIKVKDINDIKIVAQIKSLEPDLILSNNFNQILKKDILNIPKIGVVNVHPGILPFYRGMLPHFWAMALGDKKAGVTLHYVDSGVDTGDIIHSKALKIKKGDSFYTIWIKTAKLSSTVLQEYFYKLRQNGKNKILKIKEKRFERKKGKARLFRFPNELIFKKFRTQGHKLINFKDLFG